MKISVLKESASRTSDNTKRSWRKPAPIHTAITVWRFIPERQPSTVDFQYLLHRNSARMLNGDLEVTALKSDDRKCRFSSPKDGETIWRAIFSMIEAEAVRSWTCWNWKFISCTRLRLENNFQGKTSCLRAETNPSDKETKGNELTRQKLRCFRSSDQIPKGKCQEAKKLSKAFSNLLL